MRCVITGHTSGLGKAIFDHFCAKGWDVVGVSKSTGYPIPEKIDDIVELANECDLFVNCSYAAGYQLEFLERLKRSTKKIIVCSTISRHYPFADILKNEYVKNKQDLAQACEFLNTSTDITLADALLLDLAFMQDHTGDLDNPTEITSDYVISFNDVIRAIDFWLDNPAVSLIQFKWKLTPRVYGGMLRALLPDTTLAKDFKNKVDAV